MTCVNRQEYDSIPLKVHGYVMNQGGTTDIKLFVLDRLRNLSGLFCLCKLRKYKTS